MKKEKLIYSRAELEVILLSPEDVISTSNPDDATNIPGFTPTDNNGNGTIDSWNGWV